MQKPKLNYSLAEISGNGHFPMNISWQAINNSVGFGRSESDYSDDVGHLCKADRLVPAARDRSIHGIQVMCGQIGHFSVNFFATALCFNF